MSFFNNPTDAIRIFRRKGDISDPYIPITEILNVLDDCRVVLKEIPSAIKKVTVKLNGVLYSEVASNKSLQDNQYYVDYSVGIVYFKETQIGKSFTFEYNGTGVVSLPSSRIWVDGSGANVAESLQDLIDETKSTLDANTTATNTTIQNAQTSVNTAVAQANNAVSSVNQAKEDVLASKAQADTATQQANTARDNANTVATNLTNNTLINYKGTVASFSNLSSISNPAVGDVYVTTDTKIQYRRSSSGTWVQIGYGATGGLTVSSASPTDTSMFWIDTNE